MDKDSSGIDSVVQFPQDNFPFEQIHKPKKGPDTSLQKVAYHGWPCYNECYKHWWKLQCSAKEFAQLQIVYWILGS